ncbi:MAG TPA: hypothetical protein VFZ61_15690 [Polyangiales bacterium]
MRTVMRAVCALGLLLAACGDDEKKSATSKCETLVDTFCETVTSCAEDADLLDPGYSPRELLADCKDVVGDGAHCEDAKEVTSRYDACLSAASERLDCDESNDSLLFEDTFAIPVQCEGVVRY